MLMSDIKYLVVFIIFFLGKMNEENILEEILKDAADLVWPEMIIWRREKS